MNILSGDLPDSVLLSVEQGHLFSIVVLECPDFTWNNDQ